MLERATVLAPPRTLRHGIGRATWQTMTRRFVLAPALFRVLVAAAPAAHAETSQADLPRGGPLQGAAEPRQGVGTRRRSRNSKPASSSTRRRHCEPRPRGGAAREHRQRGTGSTKLAMSRQKPDKRTENLEADIRRLEPFGEDRPRHRAADPRRGHRAKAGRHGAPPRGLEHADPSRPRGAHHRGEREGETGGRPSRDSPQSGVTTVRVPAAGARAGRGTGAGGSLDERHCAANGGLCRARRGGAALVVGAITLGLDAAKHLASSASAAGRSVDRRSRETW